MARGPVDLPARLAAYVAAVGVRETAVQRRLRAATHRIPMGTMQIGPDQAALMQVLVRALGAKRCLEIGTFTGYSALAVALALPPGGRIVCCDVSEEWTAVARKYWSLAKVSGKIRLILAPALQTLKKLKGPFDFVFIDADKENYQKYYERCLRLLRRGGLIAIDNTLWHGSVSAAGPRWMRRDPRFNEAAQRRRAATAISCANR
jgi:caffeoyl-CoA O-methyltransferase